MQRDGCKTKGFPYSQSLLHTYKKNQPQKQWLIQFFFPPEEKKNSRSLLFRVRKSLTFHVVLIMEESSFDLAKRAAVFVVTAIPIVGRDPSADVVMLVSSISGGIWMCIDCKKRLIAGHKTNSVVQTCCGRARLYDSYKNAAARLRYACAIEINPLTKRTSLYTKLHQATDRGAASLAAYRSSDKAIATLKDYHNRVSITRLYLRLHAFAFDDGSDVGKCCVCKTSVPNEIDHMLSKGDESLGVIGKNKCISSCVSFPQLFEEVARNTGTDGTVWLQSLCNACHAKKSQAERCTKSTPSDVSYVARREYVNSWKRTRNNGVCEAADCTHPDDKCVEGEEMTFHLDHLHIYNCCCGMVIDGFPCVPKLKKFHL